MRKKIAAANWKMNKLHVEGIQLMTDILVKLKDFDIKDQVVICPPFIHLAQLAKMLESESKIKLGAQNCYYEESGAYTGEISTPMLSSLGVDYVIAGHSERRQLFGETNDIVTKKVEAILVHGLSPIFCCGEPLEIRKENGQQDFVKDQIQDSLFDLSTDELKRVAIAYEPIWAIGTGETASPAQAQEMHRFIRGIINEKFGEESAENITILYGGSVNAGNAESLFSQADVDGGLVGGASLKADEFVQIIQSLS